jgi:hypothetical protein
MANELWVMYNGTDTPYAVVRHSTTAKVWNATNSTWDTWDNADLSEYAVTMTDRGGRLYTAHKPAAVVMADVRVEYRVQDGASPATDDHVLRIKVAD